MWESLLLLLLVVVVRTEGRGGPPRFHKTRHAARVASFQVSNVGNNSIKSQRSLALPSFLPQSVKRHWTLPGRRRKGQAVAVGRCSSGVLFATPVKEGQAKQQQKDKKDMEGVGPRRRQSRISGPRTEEELEALRRIFEEEERPAQVEGYEFFGGETVKEELFDAEEEEQIVRQELAVLQDQIMTLPETEATQEQQQDEEEKTAAATDATTRGPYFRFQDAVSFPDELARNVGRGLQTLLNQALYDSDDGQAPRQLQDQPVVSYSPTMVWNTPLSKSQNTPIQELQQSALSFYRRIDVAVIAAETLPDGLVKVQWAISLVWPNFWDARVFISGHSLLTMAEGSTSSSSSFTIVQQEDFLEDGANGDDVFRILPSQILPRFWDMYHIGMTPAAELLPRFRRNWNLPTGFSVYEIPPRLVMVPSLDDIGGRQDAVASSLPNHAFTTLIITTGPRKQRFATTSPVQVRIQPGEVPRVEWNIAVTPEFLACAYSPWNHHDYGNVLPVPVATNDEEQEQAVACRYEFQKRRLVATVPYSGQPQDDDVGDVRRKLYNDIVKNETYKPLLDENGKPQFFYWQNDAKACFTADGGLGMAVYEYRFRWTRPNEIGIELELNNG